MITVDECNPEFRMDDPEARTPGTYALVLALHEEEVLRIGRLGALIFEPGIYLYCGSALGPGGLRGRLTRHLRAADSKRPHWHIDALTAAGQVLEIWWQAFPERMECTWAAAAAVHAHKRPLRFGASDCRCDGHLLKMADARQAARARDEIRKMTGRAVHRVCVTDCPGHDL